jgi:acylphosphatase
MFVLNEARKLGVLGTVRNVGDRDVEVRAEGDRAQLEALVERLRKGPPRAQVADVRTDWGEYLREFDDFHIEY